MCSWAVTSFKLFGRLGQNQRLMHEQERRESTYYFSTHGCKFWVSFGAADLNEDAPLVADAAARALLSKKLAIWSGYQVGKIEM